VFRPDAVSTFAKTRSFAVERGFAFSLRNLTVFPDCAHWAVVEELQELVYSSYAMFVPPETPATARRFPELDSHAIPASS